MSLLQSHLLASLLPSILQLFALLVKVTYVTISILMRVKSRNTAHINLPFCENYPRHPGDSRDIKESSPICPRAPMLRSDLQGY